MDTQAPGFIGLAVFRPSTTLLARQIASVRAQTLTNWTCLIGIDGSDPDARGLVETLTDGDERFIIREYPENVGFYRNFERILAETPKGANWIALSDQDDEWFPEKLQTLVPVLDRAALCLGQVRLVTATGDDAGGISTRKSLGLVGEFFDNQVTGSACVIRAELLASALPFPESTDLAFHDHWLGVCAAAGEGIVVVDAPLQLYIQHGQNVIGEERRTAFIDRVRNARRRGQSESMGTWRYLSMHRWGWRVNMARRLVASPGMVPRQDSAFVAATARGRLNMTLLRSMVRAVKRGEVPAARVVGLALGAVHPARFSAAIATSDLHAGDPHG